MAAPKPPALGKPAPGKPALIRIALVYVLGVVLSLGVATWVVVLVRGRLAGGPTFWPVFRELWEGQGSAMLPTLLIAGVLQAIIYRSLKAHKAVWFVAAMVVLTSGLAFGMEMLLSGTR